MKRKFKVTIGGKTFIVEVEEVTEAVSVTPAAPKLSVRPPAEEKPPEAPKALTPAPLSTPGDEGVVRAPMPGVVISIKCKVKDKVEAGDLLLTLEAMKMENEIYAPKSGVVKRIAVSEKQSVNYGDVLVEID
jgi:biotin carboxyl carrier protein